MNQVTSVDNLMELNDCLDGDSMQPVLPTDTEGYVQSFESSDPALTDFFWKYGFVVIRNAISAESVEESTLPIWDKLEKYGCIQDKPDTWLGANWNGVFESDYNLRRGFLGFDAATSASAFHAVQSPNIHEAFSHIFNQKNLWLKMDRYGLMRPTKGILKDGQPTDQPSWKTESNWLHWDQNPWLEPDFCRVQALLALSDHTATSGGFHCIPGFSSYYKTWAANNQKFRREKCLIDFPASDPIREGIQKITMRKGSLLMWDSRTPHGNWPNNDDQWRIVQYTGMFPIPDDKRIQVQRQQEMKRMCDMIPGLKLTTLGKKVLGLAPYFPEECSDGGVAKHGVFNQNQTGY